MLFSRCQLFFIKKREERKGKGEGKGKGKERPPSLMVNIVVLVCFSPLRGECFGKSSARFLDNFLRTGSLSTYCPVLWTDAKCIIHQCATKNGHAQCCCGRGKSSNLLPLPTSTMVLVKVFFWTDVEWGEHNYNHFLSQFRGPGG
jgi:hypothetical protein